MLCWRDSTGRVIEDNYIAWEDAGGRAVKLRVDWFHGYCSDPGQEERGPELGPQWMDTWE